MKAFPVCLGRRAAAIAFVLGAAISLVGPVSTISAGDCQFQLGFKTLHDLDAGDVGDCLSNQTFTANGDAQQLTTHGMLVWRKADNFTAFTDGYHTWVNGPDGVQERLSSERFSWEAPIDSATVAPALNSTIVSTPRMSALADQFFRDLNGDRKAQGLAPLALNSQLTGLAETRAQGLLAKGGQLDHYDASGHLVLREIMDDNHIPYVTAGENLAENNYGAARTVAVANTGLMNSPTHRANILNDGYNQVGVAIAGPDGGGHYYYVQIFLQA